MISHLYAGSLLICAPALVLAASISFDVVNIGGIGQGVAQVNDSGQVLLSRQSSSAVLWTSGTTIPIPFVNGEAYGLNSSGVVSGTSYQGTSYRAVLWSSNTGMTDLGIDGTADAINDSGVVIGASREPGLCCSYDAFIYNPLTGLQNVILPEGHVNPSRAGVINNTGMIAINTTSGIYIIEGGSISLISLPDATYIEADGINDVGDLVGYAYNSVTGNSRAFKWTKADGFQDLSAQYGLEFAYDINNLGEIVGTTHSGEQQAAAYISHGELHILNDLISADPTSYFYNAFAINDHSQIGVNSMGRPTALLTPNASDLPEPRTMFAVAIGLMVLATRCRRSKSSSCGPRTRRASAS